ncbi:MAG: tRNA lysidine(34) synthetase TilS [Chitinophagaceae bacterium]
MQSRLHFQAFQQHWQQHLQHGIHHQAIFIIAVSGGADSMALAHLMHRLFPERVVLAHVNYQLRQQESNNDAAAVQAWAKAQQIPLFYHQANTKQWAKQHGMGIQEAARAIRYEWFAQLLTQFEHAWICTAHHANDMVETVMLHWLRGTGIKGLVGIPEKDTDRRIVRPLLPFSRAAIEHYVTSQNIPHVHDSSNDSTVYTRNYIRLQLLPAIAERFPQVQATIFDNTQRMQGAYAIYRKAVQKKLQSLLIANNNAWHTPIKRWKHLEHVTTYLWEWLEPYGFTAAQMKEVPKLFTAKNGSTIATETHRLLVNRGWLILTPTAALATEHIIIQQHDATVVFAGGVFSLTQMKTATINTDANTALLDVATIHWPLVLRKWRIGDYFYPLGLAKKKKLARFFIDQKMSPLEKEQQWVLQDAKGTIVWLVGRRIDDRVKVTNATRQILQIQWQPLNQS